MKRLTLSFDILAQIIFLLWLLQYLLYRSSKCYIKWSSFWFFNFFSFSSQWERKKKFIIYTLRIFLNLLNPFFQGETNFVITVRWKETRNALKMKAHARSHQFIIRFSISSIHRIRARITLVALMLKNGKEKKSVIPFCESDSIRLIRSDPRVHNFIPFN